MKTKLKQILIPFILMTVFYLSVGYLDLLLEFGILAPHTGILYVSGILFGPYGAFGAVLANSILDYAGGYSIIEILPSAVISFGVSYLSYKLWYSSFKGYKLEKPKLDNIYHLFVFLGSILICGIIYSVTHGCLLVMFFGNGVGKAIVLEYLLNFINISFICGIPAIWISKKIDFIKIPQKSDRPVNKKLYRIIFIFLIAITIITIFSIDFKLNSIILIGELILITILLFAYLTKPIKDKVDDNSEFGLLEQIMNIFLITTLVIAIFGIIISIISYSSAFINIAPLETYFPTMPLLVITDIIIILFFIPGFLILRYIETKVTRPIVSFSEIEKFIKENEKIETEGLINIYSKYIKDKDEIGKLARSYTELINHNNNYIENIKKIEGEKKRIQAELEIATRIQASNLPTEAIETDDYIVNGYSKPAKEVGGDFFDYYTLDEDNLAIVIGDASGKGIPAAILAMITQVMIKQFLKNDHDPSKVLHLLNNQLCENNSETMFITLWLGIYNRNTKKVIFSNAGHNPPLIKENDHFKYLDLNSGIVLGIMEDFEYENEEINLLKEMILYTDGITDANNSNDEMYGENRLLEFFNNFNNSNPINPLLEEIAEFSENTEQFDDMTILYLKDKQL